jgi:hypothetical protein
MKYHLRIRWFIPGTNYEMQQIEGPDGSVWIRISTGSMLLAVFSAAVQGPGVMPVQRVFNVLAAAATARNPQVIINALRFLGWEFWPAVPAPLKDYIHQRFPLEIAQLEAVSAFG